MHTMGDTTKQVRVDNWGIFFLQRLQMFFSKTDYCDMTLQFEGNVQLKVHRLVMNACTEYFQFLEQTCALEDNIIMMPSDLQADVIVPIVNFMYTGMLEFHLSIFDKLYKTAQVMNITILTKLLDAQKQSVTPAKSMKKRHVDSPHSYQPAKKAAVKTAHHPELPAPLPGRKLPVWKRKSIPTPQPHPHTAPPVSFPEPKWSPAIDPLSIPDNTPKPTRFEWPDDDLPPLNPMDTSFEEISYTSKPLLTQEEEQRATTSFDDLRHTPNAQRSSSSSKKRSSPSLDMEEMKNYVKEQKIRSGLSQDDELEEEESGKRKGVELKKGGVKKVRFDEQENRGTTISIATEGKGGAELNHEKIVTEILKKYPQLVKKNKNIRLKIMAKNKAALEPAKENVQLRPPRVKVTEIQKIDSPKPVKPSEPKPDNKAPWICDRCSTDEEPMEFVLYYLYRKHMTDVHNEKFDPKRCKYCGHRCNKHNLLMYHLYTKHGMKPPPGYNFPKCDQCPFIALSANILTKHKLKHGKNEIQCVECKLAFTSQATLTSHIQITGHTGKSNKSNYDCQYCTKRFQSGVNLFSHVRLQHKNEAVRDGIVSIEEMDDIEEYDEEDSQQDEYILPEIISDPEPQPPKKVNILSNVKVQDRSEQRHLSLEPSSEAEALNNVASGIATSLGLVDIVVLNENQQYFLQQNQQNFNQNDQPEFILPELTGRDSFSQNQNEVITTDGVITPMLSSSDIGSTDELVMVLTDHDYGDNQEEMNNDSNIVVLYSHPVDGQQDQFITSQGNIMVNSQGLIEIRNGATITSTASEVVMTPQEPHIESIEMIQREIESHQELKQEQEEEKKPEIAKEAEGRSDPLIESLTQGEQLEFTSPLVVEESEGREVNEETNESEKNVETQTEEKESEGEKNEEELEVEAPPVEEAPPEPEEATVEESEPQKEENPISEEAPVAEEPTPPEEPTEPTSSVVEDKENETLEEREEVRSEETETAPEPKEPEEQAEAVPEVEESKEETETPVVEETSEAPPVEEPPEKEDKEEEKSEEKLTEEVADNSKTDTENEEREEEKSQEENAELSQSDTSTSQFNDENSQSSQDSRKQEETVSTKISILDDWEDTDSQQSDKEKQKVAGETVHKLMDDWGEEEEEEEKKEAV